MIARPGRTGCLDLVPACCITLEVEAVRETPVNVLEIRIGGVSNNRWNVGPASGSASGVLVDDGQRIVIAAVLVAATYLKTLRGIRQCKRVVHVLTRSAD